MLLEPSPARYLCGLCLLCVLAVGSIVYAEDSSATDPPSHTTDVPPFLKQHCLRCHGPATSEGDFRVDQHLPLEFDRAAVSAAWNEVINVLNSHEMPPGGEPQPDATSVAQFVDWVRAQQIRAEAEHRKSKVILRRLNRNEYRNTIFDLTGVDFDISHFPQDPSAAGFDNNGRALSSSPLQIELYLAAAQSILSEAMISQARLRQPRPQTVSWRFEPETGDSDSNRVRYGEHNAIVNGGKNGLSGNARVMHHASWDRTINARDFAVPSAGRYVVRVRAASLIPTRDEVVAYADRVIRENRAKEMQKHPERRKWIEAHLDDEIDHFRKSPSYDYGPGRLKLTVHLNGQPQVIGEFDVDANKDAMKVFEFPIKMSTEKAGITLEYAYSIPAELENFQLQRSDEFPRPQVIVDWFEIEGPVGDAWPPQSHQRLIGNHIPDRREEQRELAVSILKRFMPRAYRRPVTTAEIDVKIALYDSAESDDFIERIRVPLTAILVSPNFLHLAEPATERDVGLDSFQIASRLSYFLWSSMPDETLFLAAARNELSQPAQRTAQIDRMLADPRIAALGINFAAQWLGLREVGANPPAGELYPHYSEHVEQSLVRQSIALFDDILDNDRDLADFIDSDHEMLNEVLARYYELPPVRGDHFQRVKLPSGSQRGGVLTHGSVLTITSNGTRTSPVKRGTWILKNVLGDDPGLPVANAGDIAPKVPGIDKATVRQRLEIHRQLAQCARCHNKIDPLGFALENYDASGRYRLREGFGYQGRIQDDDPLIDASGLLPDGTELNGIKDLKAAVLKDDAKFVRCFTEKLFTYAMGREIAIADGAIIDDILADVSAAKEQDSARTIRSIIHSICTSSAFTQ